MLTPAAVGSGISAAGGSNSSSSPPLLTVRGRGQHDEDRDQRPGDERDDDRKHGQLQSVDSFVLCQHIQRHPTERATRPVARATPGAAEGGIRLGPQEAVSCREGPIGLGSTVVVGEPVFDLRDSGWFHIALVG